MQHLSATVNQVCLYCWTEREFVRKPAAVIDLKVLVAQLRRAISQDLRRKRGSVEA